MMNPLFLSITTLLFILTTTTTATPVGIVYDPTQPNLPPVSTMITAFIHHRISNVNLLNPTPSSIHAFSSTNITLILSLPNTFIHSFALNQSSSASWLVNNVLPFHHTTRISIISIETANQLTRFHLPALRNLYSNLLKFGIVNVKVSTTLRFGSVLVVKNWFTPSQSEIIQPELMRSLVRFLRSTNSSFLVTLYPYYVYSSGYSKIPLRFALFQDYGLDVITDEVSGVEYWNLFDMMVDAMVFAVEDVGEGNVPVIVAETGWPGESLTLNSYAYWSPVYLNGLMKHLKKTSSKRMTEVYVYEVVLADWSILNDEKMSFKYDWDSPVFGIHEVDTSDHHEEVDTSDQFAVLWFVAFALVVVIVMFGVRKIGYFKLLKVN